MPSERLSPDDPREWLNRASSNLIRAKTHNPEVYLEDLCFDAQQAAEKAIKAVLLKAEISFPYIHDLATLLSLLEKAEVTIPQTVREAGRLTRFAVATRYPGITEPVTEEEYRASVSIAATVVAWAEQHLKGQADT